MSRFVSAGYAAAGESHIRAGLPCQDALYYLPDAFSPVSAAALSDGAGSFSQAQTGAELTARIAAAFIAAHFEELYQMASEERCKVLLTHLQRALFREAKRIGCDISDLSATLLVCAMHRDRRWMTFHIGDGTITVCNTAGTCRLLSAYSHKYLNLTHFVTSVEPHCQTHAGKGDVTGFLLTSDGAEPLIRAEDGKFAQLLLQMAFTMPQAALQKELHAFDRMLRSIGMDDDISCMLLTDAARTPEMIRQMQPSVRQKLLGIPLRERKRTARERDRLLGALAAAGERGIPLRSAARLLHTHQKHNTLRRLRGLTDHGMLVCRNGTLYLHHHIGGVEHET